MMGKMSVSRQMRLVAKKVALVDRTWLVATAGEIMDWADEVAQLEDVVEVLSDAPGAPIFVYVKNFSRDEIIRWVQKYANWTIRRLKTLAKLENK